MQLSPAAPMTLLTAIVGKWEDSVKVKKYSGTRKFNITLQNLPVVQHWSLIKLSQYKDAGTCYLQPNVHTKCTKWSTLLSMTNIRLPDLNYLLRTRHEHIWDTHSFTRSSPLHKTEGNCQLYTETLCPQKENCQQGRNLRGAHSKSFGAVGICVTWGGGRGQIPSPNIF